MMMPMMLSRGPGRMVKLATQARHPGDETAVEVDAAETKASSSLKAPVPRKTLPVDPGVCVRAYLRVCK